MTFLSVMLKVPILGGFIEETTQILRRMNLRQLVMQGVQLGTCVNMSKNTTVLLSSLENLPLHAQASSSPQPS